MRLFLSTLAIVFAGLIVWALGEKPISESADFFFNDPWGIVSLVDLYIGFLIFIFFIAKTSANHFFTLLWSVALLILGNVIALAYLVCYLSGFGVTKRNFHGL